MISYKELSTLFSSRRVSEFSAGDSSFLLKVAAHYKEHLSDEFTPTDVYDACYKDLSANYRGEYLYKNTVAEKILMGRHSLNTATAISEFRVGKSKADCVIVNGHSTCYEIKSEFDNLDRLENQLQHYQKLFDKVYIVTSKHHINRILDRNNHDIGVIELTKRNTLSIVREATIQDCEIDIEILMRSLRMAEYIDVVRHVYGNVPNLPNTEIFHACEKLLISAHPQDVRKAFCTVIKKSRKPEQSFIKKLPKCLLTAGISYKLSKNRQTNLVKNLTKSISKDTICTTLF